MTSAPSQPSVPALLIKKEGDYPSFWHKDTSFISVMEELYERVRTKGRLAGKRTATVADLRKRTQQSGPEKAPDTPSRYKESRQMHPARQRLAIDLEDLKMAWSGGVDEMAHYLDRQTGEVVSVTGETQRVLDALLARKEDAAAETFLAAIQDQPWPQWQRQAVYAAAVVELADGDRFLSIPRPDAQEAYDDRVAFVQTVRDARIRAQLQDALQGNGAFGRFKAVLGRYPNERERWFRFEDERIHQRVLEWLEAEMIAPVAPGSSVLEDR